MIKQQNSRHTEVDMRAEQWMVEHAHGTTTGNAHPTQRMSNEQAPTTNRSAGPQPAGAPQSRADATRAVGVSAPGWWNMRTCLGVPISIGG
jgi:hypothetical protein